MRWCILIIAAFILPLVLLSLGSAMKSFNAFPWAKEKYDEPGIIQRSAR